MSGSNERINLLFHTRVLGRSDREAIIRDYCGSLDAAWPGVQAILDRNEFTYFTFLYKYWSRYEAVFSPNKKEKPWLDSCRAQSNEGSPAHALVLACLCAVGCPEADIEAASKAD